MQSNDCQEGLKIWSVLIIVLLFSGEDGDGVVDFDEDDGEGEDEEGDDDDEVVKYIFQV